PRIRCASTSTDHETPTTDTYTLSLHDALPISGTAALQDASRYLGHDDSGRSWSAAAPSASYTDLSFRMRPVPPHPGPLPEERERSEEHTSEVQSLAYLVCRLLLGTKKSNA